MLDGLDDPDRPGYAICKLWCGGRWRIHADECDRSNPLTHRMSNYIGHALPECRVSDAVCRMRPGFAPSRREAWVGMTDLREPGESQECQPQLNGHLELLHAPRDQPGPVRRVRSQLHLDRRGSLYRTLGVTPLAVRGARVLEVAPGTGQNSLYPRSPRPAQSHTRRAQPGCHSRHRRRLMPAAGAAAGAPLVIESRFEDYEPDERFDVVVCENWLGSSDHERRLLAEAGQHGRGWRRACSSRPFRQWECCRTCFAVPCRGNSPHADEPFAERTARLCRAIGPHLRTLTAMTRGVTDWVHDNMLNPAYFGIMLTVPMVLAELVQRV